jgi:L-amino acid N-acyltransferase YncA
MSLRQLVPFSAAALPVVEPWFDDADTLRWLGDRRWPAMALRLSTNPPPEALGDRTASVDRRSWLFEEEGVAVALLDVEVYEDQRAGCAFVVDPRQRGRGCGQRALQALVRHVATTGVRELFAGAEPENSASIRCLEGAGFVSRSDKPDAEGFLYFVRAT